MPRIILIHWKAAEAEEPAERLRRTGGAVEIHVPRNAEALRAFRTNPPDAFVIDLTRLPSQGRDAALFLRRQKATRHVPLVFAGGEPEKVAQAQCLLPGAVFTRWPRIATALRRALAHTPSTPVVPGVLAGYAGTPLPKKLGIKPGLTVVLIGAPKGFASSLGEMPRDTRLTDRVRAGADLLVLFAKSKTDLEQRLPAASRAMVDGGGLWIAWRKKASGVATDLGEAVVRATGLRAGLVDYKVAAIDNTWSGLKFARRRM